jgi:predicted phage terminase large subunit-like protein
VHYYNEKRTADDWEYVVNTLLSRKENSEARIVVVMHRWGKDDICGKLLEKEGKEWAVIKFPAYDVEHDIMLDPSIMTKEDYLNRKTLTNVDIFAANYMQQIMELEGYLYAPFQTYDKNTLPEKFEFVGFYEDTADQGDDYLAGGFFGYLKGKAYMLEIIYTQINAEITEIETCDTIIKLKATTGIIESNSGGHAYARNIRRILEERKCYFCSVNEFTQSENKQARILTNRTNVTNNIIMPFDWNLRWPEFYKHVNGIKIKGTWEHDDAEDMLTGIYEKYIDYTPLTF